MIGKLSGFIDSFEENYVLLDVGGVGYVVFLSPKTMNAIGQKGDGVSLLIETQVREDSLTLFGFLEASEQKWFKMLTGVQGVGAKAAMAILGVTPPDQLLFALASGDKAALTRADGVGPKLAARIITELKDKAAKLDLSTNAVDRSVDGPVDVSISSSTIDQDAVSALVNLGYGRSDAYQAILQAKNDNENIDLEDLIKMALKELSL